MGRAGSSEIWSVVPGVTWCQVVRLALTVSLPVNSTASTSHYTEMGDTETVHSVRGKGWVKFEDEGDDVSTSTSTASTRRMSSTEDSPGSIEVSGYDSPHSFKLSVTRVVDLQRYQSIIQSCC